MDPSYRRKVIIFAAVVYAIAVIISVSCLVLKRDAIQFHTRDYNYFIEQAARYTDPNLSKRFALNIEGYNMLGLQGIEGVQSLYHAIHAEYFRYSYVLLYGIFHSTLPIYIFYSLVFFSPILYYAYRSRLQTKDAWKGVILFTSLYVLFPATLNCVTADLRPRMLFSAAWCLAALAIYFDRPFLEKLLLFGLLIGIREEGILLGFILIVLNFLKMQGKPGQWKQTFVLLALDVVAFAMFLAFMAWGGFNRVDSVYDPLNLIRALAGPLLPSILVGAALLALLVGVYAWKQRTRFLQALPLGVYATAILLTGFQTVRDMVRWYQAQSAIAPVSAWNLYIETVSNPTIALTFYVSILLLALLYEASRSVSRKILGVVLVGLCLVFGATTLAIYPSQIAAWRQNLEPARFVWEFTESHDPYQTHVLLDYDTYQAFYDYEHILVYNRLPLWITTPKKRYYPENKEVLVKLIKRELEYAVIGRSSLPQVQELAQLAEVPVTELAANDRYVILKLR